MVPTSTLCDAIRTIEKIRMAGWHLETITIMQLSLQVLLMYLVFAGKHTCTLDVR